MNNSTQDNESLQWTPPNAVYANRTMITLYSILFVWSLLGNVLVIAVVYCNQNLRTNVNYLIVNMAVSDLLVPLVAMPWCIWMFVTNDGKWLVDGPLGEALCKLVPFLSHISPFVSSISLVIIAFQRFIAVVYPTRRQILSRKTRWIAIAFPWIVAMALFSPYFYAYRLTNESGYTMCTYSWSPAFNYWKAETILTCIQTAVGFVIPFITIIIFYTIIVYRLHKSLNNVMDVIGEETKQSRQRRNIRIFSMSLTMVLLFFICWCPFHTLYLLFLSRHSLWSDNIELMKKMSFAFVYLWYFLAAINPYIYFMFLRDFRQGLKRLCCRKTAPEISKPICKRPRRPGGDSNQDPTCTPPHLNTTSNFGFERVA